MANYIYSLRTHSGLAHHTNCPVVRRIAKENRIYLTTDEELIERRLCLCSYCRSAAGMKFHAEKAEIRRFASKNHFRVRYDGERIRVLSKVDEWIITANADDSALLLYHRNTSIKRNDPTDIPGFHPQKVRYARIVPCLEYIAAHDTYREARFKSPLPAPDWSNLRVLAGTATMEELVAEYRKSLAVSAQDKPVPRHRHISRRRREDAESRACRRELKRRGAGGKRRGPRLSLLDAELRDALQEYYDEANWNM